MGSALAVRDVPVLLALGGLADLDVGAALLREVLGDRDDGLTAGVEDGLVTIGRHVVVVQGLRVEHLVEPAHGSGSTQAQAQITHVGVVPVGPDLLGALGAQEAERVVLLARSTQAARGDVVLHDGVGGDSLVGVHGVLLGRDGHLVPVGDVLVVQILVVGAGVVRRGDLTVGVDDAGAHAVGEAELEVLLLDGALLAAPALVVPLLSGELAEADPAHDGPVGADVTQVLLTAAQTGGDDGLVHDVLLGDVGEDRVLHPELDELAVVDHQVEATDAVDVVLEPLRVVLGRILAAVEITDVLRLVAPHVGCTGDECIEADAGEHVVGGIGGIHGVLLDVVVDDVRLRRDEVDHVDAEAAGDEAVVVLLAERDLEGPEEVTQRRDARGAVRSRTLDHGRSRQDGAVGAPSTIVLLSDAHVTGDSVVCVEDEGRISLLAHDGYFLLVC